MFITWGPLFEIGVPEIDRQHEHLVSLVNAFYDAHEAGASPAEVFSTLNRLVQYVEEHFASEEALMNRARYPDLARHRVEHEKLIRQIFDLNERLEAGTASVDDEVMAFLKGWLVDHLLHEDRKVGEHLARTGIPPGWEE